MRCRTTSRLLSGLASMDRRTFLSGAMAVGTALYTGPLSAQVAETPKRGGTFRLGLGAGSTSDSLDPGTYDDAFMQTTGHALHNYLTEVNSDLQIVGELAESWEPSLDAKTWRFKLRSGVEFHNGKSLEVEDVIASMNHHRGPGSTSGGKFIGDQIEDMKNEGKGVIVFTLVNGNADFPALLSEYHLPILPSVDGKIDPSSGIGCGPYVLEKFEPGIRMTANRNANYWKTDHAWFDSIQFLSIVDVAARTNALVTGQIDAMNRCDLKTLKLLQRSPNILINSVAGGQHYTLPMDTRAKPFADNNVRMALKHAIDRQALIDVVLQGHGRVGNDHPIDSSLQYFDKDIPQRTYDPDKAKFYLKQSGLSTLSVDLSTAEAAFPGAVDVAILYKEQASKADIDINVIREPNDGYWSNVWLKKPWCMAYWGGKPTEDWAFSPPYAAKSPYNETHWSDERFNSLLMAARAELDEKKRAEMYGEMQLRLRDEGGSVIPIFANYVQGLSSDIGHGKVGANWDMDGLRAAERWWFKSS